MNNAAKWKEFVEWWDEGRERREFFIRGTVIAMIDEKIKEIQKSNNAKQ